MIGFAHWRSDQASGGNRYDNELLTGLPAAGVDLRLYRVRGPWPLPTAQQRRSLPEVLACEEQWLVDNIVGSAAPEAIARAVGEGRRVTLLMHYFPADDLSLSRDQRSMLARSERDAVLASTAVVVTSQWAADVVAARYGRTDAVVARPGVGAAPLSPGSDAGTTILWLSRLTSGKDPFTFVQALAQVRDLPWRAALVGPHDVEPAVTDRVRRLIAAESLADRIEVAGARQGDALEDTWARADLLVHTSLAETYGMVVAEALARGIASVVADGTGATEAQAAGATFPAGDADSLARTLRTWLTDAELRHRWRRAAQMGRSGVQTWDDSVAIVARALRA